MIKFKQWLENQMPSVLYHHSHQNNRQSILQHGLQGKYDQTVDLKEPGVVGGVFLSSKPDHSTKSDVWEVDVRGLHVEEDWSGQSEDEQVNWYVVYQDIPPNRIKLITSQ
jgi:hypothetical protein